MEIRIILTIFYVMLSVSCESPKTKNSINKENYISIIDTLENRSYYLSYFSSCSNIDTSFIDSSIVLDNYSKLSILPYRSWEKIDESFIEEAICVYSGITDSISFMVMKFRPRMYIDDIYELPDKEIHKMLHGLDGLITERFISNVSVNKMKFKRITFKHSFKSNSMPLYGVKYVALIRGYAYDFYFLSPYSYRHCSEPVITRFMCKASFE